MHELLTGAFGRYVQLTDEEVRKLPAFFQHKKIRKKQYLLKAGEICRADFFVIKGCLRQYATNEEGHDNIVQFALDGWWISDLHSMSTHTPSIYDIDALENSEVLQLDLSARERLLAEIPALNIYWRNIMQNAFATLQRRVLFLQRPLEERYHDFLERYGYFEQRIPQHQIAAYLGATRESLSRIRHAVLKK